MRPIEIRITEKLDQMHRRHGFFPRKIYLGPNEFLDLRTAWQIAGVPGHGAVHGVEPFRFNGIPIELMTMPGIRLGIDPVSINVFLNELERSRREPRPSRPGGNLSDVRTDSPASEGAWDFSATHQSFDGLLASTERALNANAGRARHRMISTPLRQTILNDEDVTDSTRYDQWRATARNGGQLNLADIARAAETVRQAGSGG